MGDREAAGFEIGEARRFLDEPKAFLAAPKCFVSFLPLVHVARDAHVSLGAVRKPEGYGVGFYMAPPSMQTNDLISPDDAFTRDDAAVHIEAIVEIFGRNRHVAWLAQSFHVGRLEQFEAARIDVNETARFVEYLHAIGHRVEYRCQPRLAVAQRVLSFDLRGDFLASRDHMAVRSQVVLDRISAAVANHGRDVGGTRVELLLDVRAYLLERLSRRIMARLHA